MSRKALVIGSEGNIGSPLVQHLTETGWEVLEVDHRPGWRKNYLMCDINHPLDMLPAFDWMPEVVFMLSAMVSRVTCEQASSLAVTTNLTGLNHVIQLSRRVGAHLVYFSTSEVYGPNLDLMDEALSDPQPNNRYGLTKLIGEKLVEYEVRINGLSAITLRPFMMYDEDEDLGEHRSAMIRFANNLGRGLPIDVHRGSARGWLHVSDAVAAIERAGSIRNNYDIINIGNGEIVPIEQLAEMIRQEFDAPRSLINVLDLPPQMTLRKNPSLQRQRDVLNYEPKVPLIEGVKRVCDRIRRVLYDENQNCRLSAARIASSGVGVPNH